MEVTITAVKEVLDGVEDNLERALHESVAGMSPHKLDNRPHIRTALENVQAAIIHLLLVR